MVVWKERINSRLNLKVLHIPYVLNVIPIFERQRRAYFSLILSI